eukprot:4851488-Amphidinium_carterae.1
MERRDLQLRAVSYRATARDENDFADPEHPRRHQITRADELQAVYDRLRRIIFKSRGLLQECLR